MRLKTRVKAHKAIRRGLRQGIRDFERKQHLLQIRGMAAQGAPKVKGMKKKVIWRLKNGGTLCTMSTTPKNSTRTIPESHQIYLSLQRKIKRRQKRRLKIKALLSENGGMFRRILRQSS
jgi:hypothetical protein